MFPTKSFYNTTTPPRGSTKKEFLHRLQKRKKVEERAESYKASPLSDLQRYVKIFSERKVWKWFSRQQEALDYCSGMREDSLRLFAYEKSDGKRKFLVTTVKQFWNKYSSMCEKDKHFYEVIALHNTCRLYFDIEYETELNAGVDGVAVLETFIQYVCHCIFLEYDIRCDRKHVVDLESSTEKKFSRHLIFHIDGAVFVDNVSAGLFVKDLCSCLKSFLESGNKNKFLPVQDIAVDTEQNAVGNTTTTETGNSGVVSAEVGTNAPEPQVSERCTVTTADTSSPRKCTTETNSTSSIADEDNISKQYTWAANLDSIIVNSSNGRALICDLAVYTKNRNFRLYQSSKVSKNVPLSISKENEFVFTEKLSRKERNRYRNRGEVFDSAFQKFCDTLICDTKRNARVLCYGDTCVTEKHTMPRPLTEGSQTSPYPDLDVFVMRQVKRFCNRGVIRRWLVFDQSKIIIYDIDDNHWCGNINREHKSNHVYYIADLKFKVLYQKCHDPDCANYRSPEVAIPDGVNPMVEVMDIEEFDVSCDVELNRLFSDDITVDGLNCSNDISKNKDSGNGRETISKKNSCNDKEGSSSSSNDSGLNDISNEELSVLFDEDFDMEMTDIPNEMDESVEQNVGQSNGYASVRIPQSDEKCNGIDGLDLSEFFQDEVFNFDDLHNCGNEKTAETNPTTSNETRAVNAQEEESKTSVNDQCVPEKLEGDGIHHVFEQNRDNLSYDLFSDIPGNSKSSFTTRENSDAISDLELSKLFDNELGKSINSDCNCLCDAENADELKDRKLNKNSDKENIATNSKHDNKHDSLDGFNHLKDLSSILVDTTPLKQHIDNIAVLDDNSFSPSASPPLVSTRRKPSRKSSKTKAPLACNSFSGEKSFTGRTESIGNDFKSPPELDARSLDRIFSGDDPENEFSLIL